MKLENNCATYLKEDRFKHIPSYIKRASGASMLFRDKAWPVDVKARKSPDKSWEEDPCSKDDNLIFTYIVSDDFRHCLQNRFNVEDLSNFFSGSDHSNELSENDFGSLSLHKIFTDNKKVYTIGDNLFIKLFDPQSGDKNIEHSRECTITDIERDEFGPIVTLKVNLEDFDDIDDSSNYEYFYRIRVFVGGHYESNNLILQSFWPYS